MRGPPGDSVEAFEELRRLLLSGEREQPRDLRHRLNNRERRSKDVAGVLPEAVKLSGERGEELVQALRPAVEGSISSRSKRSRTPSLVRSIQLLDRWCADRLRKVCVA